MKHAYSLLQIEFCLFHSYDYLTSPHMLILAEHTAGSVFQKIP